MAQLTNPQNVIHGAQTEAAPKKTKAVKNQRPEMRINIKYDTTSALYVSQFIVNQSDQEVFIDLSSGPIPDPTTGQTMVPIHTRLALSYHIASRLGKLLTQATEQHKNKK